MSTPAKTLAAPPVRTAFPDANSPSLFSRAWIQWLQQLTNAINAILKALADNSIDVGTFS